MRMLNTLPLLTLAALCAASPALSAEERVKHPQPVDSLLYPGEYGASPTTETGRHDDYKDKSEVSDKTGTRASEPAKGTKATSGKRDAKAATSKTTTRKKSVAVSDTNERPIGTPGSPTTKGVRGTPGEKPVPGRK